MQMMRERGPVSKCRRFRAYAVALAADGRHRRDPGLCQRRALFLHRHLGSLSDARRSAGRDWQNRIARAATLVTTKYGIPA